MTDTRQVVSALIDREPVDPDLLAQVLEEPANRALLVDFVRLRAALHADDADEASWTAGTLPPLKPGISTWLRRAATVVLLVGAGASAGVWAEHLISQERPPEPTRIVHLQPLVP